MAVIEFHISEPLLSQIPQPYPAARHVPEWFKQMATDHEAGGTLKRCPPFLAAMTAGYIIPAPFDAHLRMTAPGEVVVSGPYNYLSTHFPKQFAGAPFHDKPVIKFRNPWVIVTPPEYVCLITAPVNRFELPFLPLTGIVETGTYYKEVQLPMACLLRPGESYLLERGAPMIQVVPMLREQWESHTAPLDLNRWNQQHAKFENNPHFYKDEFWRKLEYL